MIELNIITAFLTSLISLMIARKDHINHFLENLVFSKKLILLLLVSSGLTILLIGSLIENNFTALSFPVFLILFLFYLFIITLKRKLRDINESNLRKKMVYSSN